MYSTKNRPLSDEYPGHDFDRSDARLRPRTAFRSSGFGDVQFKSAAPPLSRRIARSVAGFFFAVFVGVGGTLAWQVYGDEAKEMIRTWAPSVAWLLPAPTVKAPAPAVTSAELQLQLKPVALDVAIVRRSIEQLAANQDQLARKQEQVTQAIAALQAAQQDIDQKISAPPPPPKAVHVPPPKAQTATQ